MTTADAEGRQLLGERARRRSQEPALHKADAGSAAPIGKQTRTGAADASPMADGERREYLLAWTTRNLDGLDTTVLPRFESALRGSGVSSHERATELVNATFGARHALRTIGEDLAELATLLPATDAKLAGLQVSFQRVTARARDLGVDRDVAKLLREAATAHETGRPHVSEATAPIGTGMNSRPGARATTTGVPSRPADVHADDASLSDSAPRK